ncbi:sensitivity to high expression protein she9 [Blyttiomyces sp. JEL0837]|nr:sensitivity to high expression protein she9 [Blyttiomyces sp. JEL0837]
MIIRRFPAAVIPRPPLFSTSSSSSSSSSSSTTIPPIPSIPHPKPSSSASSQTPHGHNQQPSSSSIPPQLSKKVNETLSQVSHVFNTITGYSHVERRKKKVQEIDEGLNAARKHVASTKREYESVIDERRKCQREINSLLQRKDTWLDTDVVRFTELYRKDLMLEQEESNAKSQFSLANEKFDQLHSDFLTEVRERYIEEQLYSDKIRQASTWWTMGLISFHLILFMVINLREPYKTRRAQKLMTDSVSKEVGLTMQAEGEKIRAEVQKEFQGALEIVRAQESSKAIVDADGNIHLDHMEPTSVFLGGVGIGVAVGTVAMLALR